MHISQKVSTLISHNVKSELYYFNMKTDTLQVKILISALVYYNEVAWKNFARIRGWDSFKKSYHQKYYGKHFNKYLGVIKTSNEDEF